jgi:hypothetical protein
MCAAGPQTIMGSNTAGGQAFAAADVGVRCRSGAPDWIAVPIAPKTGELIDQTARTGNHALFWTCMTIDCRC